MTMEAYICLWKFSLLEIFLATQQQFFFALWPRTGLWVTVELCRSLSSTIMN